LVATRYSCNDDGICDAAECRALAPRPTPHGQVAQRPRTIPSRRKGGAGRKRPRSFALKSAAFRIGVASAAVGMRPALRSSASNLAARSATRFAPRVRWSSWSRVSVAVTHCGPVRRKRTCRRGSDGGGRTGSDPRPQRSAATDAGVFCHAVTPTAYSVSQSERQAAPASTEIRTRERTRRHAGQCRPPTADRAWFCRRCGPRKIRRWYIPAWQNPPGGRGCVQAT
jgi:hypothetical protein